MEFEFAKDFQEAEEKHNQWWLSLTPAQRWKANWAHLEFLKKCNPGLYTKFFIEADVHKFVLK